MVWYGRTGSTWKVLQKNCIEKDFRVEGGTRERTHSKKKKKVRRTSDMGREPRRCGVTLRAKQKEDGGTHVTGHGQGPGLCLFRGFYTNTIYIDD